MLTFSLAVMTHPARHAWLDRLLPSLGTDPVTPIVVEDTHSEGIWPNQKRALLTYDRSADRHIVVQDDIGVCRDFQAGVEAVLRSAPADQPVSLFYPRWGKRLVDDARKRGESWISVQGADWAQAWCWPTAMIKPMIEWIEAHIDPSMPLSMDDTRIALYCLAHDRSMWITVPNLVEHLGYDTSLVGAKSSLQRSSAYWIGPDRSPLEIDWTKGVIPGETKAAVHMHDRQSKARQYLLT